MLCCLVTIVQVRYYVVLLLSNHCAGKILCSVA